MTTTPGEPVGDEDIKTSGITHGSDAPQDADGTDGSSTDSSDADSSDSTDAAGTDGTSSADADGTDG